MSEPIDVSGWPKYLGPTGTLYVEPPDACPVCVMTDWHVHSVRDDDTFGIVVVRGDDLAEYGLTPIPTEETSE